MNWQKAKVTFIAAKVQLFFEIIILEVTNYTYYWNLQAASCLKLNANPAHPLQPIRTLDLSDNLVPLCQLVTSD